jgi:3-oxoadipate enol-lactonase
MTEPQEQGMRRSAPVAPVIDLYVEEHGDGPPLLLVQGLGYAVWAWERQLPAFAAAHRTLAYDQRGSGRSPKSPGPYSMTELADDAASVLERRGVARAHVLGFSMGGYVAQILALRRPELVDRLVLVATSPGGPGSVPQPAETASAWAAARGLPPDEYARATMPLSFAPGWTAEHPDDYETLLAARLAFPTPPDAWAAQYAACVEFLEEGAPVERIANRSLVVHGDRDRVVAFENGRLLARRLPSARLETFAGHGHLLAIEDAPRFNGLVLDFLAV